MPDIRAVLSERDAKQPECIGHAVSRTEIGPQPAAAGHRALVEDAVKNKET